LHKLSNMNHKSTLLVLLAFLIGFSCKKASNDQTVTPPPTVKKIAPDGFTYNTTKEVTVSVRLLAPDNTPVTDVPVSFYTSLAVQENGNADENSAVYTGLSDKSGYVSGTMVLPAYVDTVLIDAKYTGIIRNVKGYLSGSAITAVLGGTDVLSGNVSPSVANPPAFHRPGGANGSNGITYVSMGSTDNQGRPQYLVSPSDVISNTLISYLNTSLPESKALPTSHPQYLTDSATGDVNVVADADVWVTFVTEGAGYVNSVGYYTFPTANPPSTTADITKINLMFPNASLYGSGGNMRAGDKVKLGTFKAGTSIGFVLFPNGWAGNGNVNTGGTKYFTDTKLNPEPTMALKRHTVLLNDAADGLYLVGFEDLDRSSSGCDNDFNDVVFYTTSNPITAISTVNVQPIDVPGDKDGDGVTDVFDQYPTDPTRAYNTWYPSASSFATLAFEDLWPATGDYDMNDLLVNYRYKIVSNAQNKVVELYGDYAVQAAGASFKNGFGVQFPFAANLVKQVTGQKFVSNYITLASNGVEAKQSKAVIVPFDNYNALINNPGNAYFINTRADLPKVTGDTAHVYVQFTSPITAATLGSAPFNPFLISNLTRGTEIHLPGNAPTDLVNASLLGAGEDVSNAAKGIYYVSKSNWPWAINFPGVFTYPQEGVNITAAYLHFLDWSGSNGVSYTDWFSNQSAGYLDNTKLYKK